MQHLFKEQTTKRHFLINSIAGITNLLTGIVVVVFAIILVVAIVLAMGVAFPRNAIKKMFERWRFSAELKKDGKYVLPPILKLCRMNRNASKEQQRILTKTYSSAIIPYFKKGMKPEETEGAMEESLKYLYDLDLDTRKAYVILLFRLAAANDGIMNDEWNFIQMVIERLEFDKESLTFFNKKYAPLHKKTEEQPTVPELQIEAKPAVTDDLLRYYVELGLNSNASPAEVEQAIHLLALLNHPDLPKNQDRKEECEKLMEKYSKAYEMIANRE